MQHVLRCWERQCGGSEYKKTLLRPGLCPDPTEGAYSAPANPLVGGKGLAVPSPRTPSPALGPSGLASSTRHSKISSDAVGRVAPFCRDNVPRGGRAVFFASRLSRWVALRLPVLGVGIGQS